MTIPDYQTMMLPLLEHLARHGEQHISDAAEAMADHFNLSAEERRKLLPSGRSPVYRSRVGWARTYLAKAGLLESPRRGFWRISDRGRKLLAEKPERIDSKYLARFPEFVAFVNLCRDRKDVNEPTAVAGDESTETPEEALEAAYSRLRGDLEAEVLAAIKSSSPAFFERCVVDLLVAMGYGGSLSDAGQAVGRSHDGGIDGIIKEDRLGLDAIYVQAKRWENPVGRPEIQKFAGALQGYRARKGVFLTTSAFTAEATDFASGLDSKIVLIDGQRLAELMVEHNVGVSPVRTFTIKKLDSDYFAED